MFMDDKFGPHSVKDIREICDETTTDPNAERVCIVNEEIRQGLNIISRYPKKVTFFGSARAKETDEEYQKARHLAYRLSKELGYTIVTGGAAGVMEAANRGAFEAKGHSVGLNIELPNEQRDNPYLTQEIPFHYFFTRKVTLTFAARLYIYFPGGFGTLDEFYEILTLVQTRKIHQVPIVCMGAWFWESVDNSVHKALQLEHNMISPEDHGLYTITDDEATVMEIARNAQSRV
jgi:uncharacterized protein (TIGR00730 family)